MDHPPESSKKTEHTSVKASEDTKITVHIRTAKRRESFAVADGCTVEELKELIRTKFAAKPEQLCLIFGGKIMKDKDTLKQHNIKEGMAIHLVIRDVQQPSENVSNIPTQPVNVPRLETLSQLDFGNTFSESHASVLNELLQNPDLLRTLLDDAFIQEVMSNPETIRAFILRNSQIQELMEQNAEISHLLNNPSLLRQTMELARNPSLLQEMMRNYDRAISNLESTPGGFNDLQRIYRDIQEPMLSATSGQISQNHFATPVNDTSANNPQQGRENVEPLPNPWNSQNPQPSTTVPPSAGQETVSSHSALNILHQMSGNPSLLQNVLSASQIQAIIQAATTNSADNPLLASLDGNNSEFQEQLRNNLPQALEQFQNQELNQFASAYQSEQQIPPENSPLSPTKNANAPTNGTNGPSSNTNVSSGQAASDLFTDLMSRIAVSMESTRNSVPPEQRYQTELEQLEGMGFSNRQENLQALIAANGDINVAIEKILSSVQDC